VNGGRSVSESGPRTDSEGNAGRDESENRIGGKGDVQAGTEVRFGVSPGAWKNELWGFASTVSGVWRDLQEKGSFSGESECPPKNLGKSDEDGRKEPML